MAALTKNTEREYIRTGRSHVRVYPVQDDVHIFIGALVSINANENVGPSTDLADQVFIGIAKSEADNTGGASGDKTVEVELKPTVWLTIDAGAANTYGKAVSPLDSGDLHEGAGVNIPVTGTVIDVDTVNDLVLAEMDIIGN